MAGELSCSAVWTWGSDGYGRLGLGTEDKHQGKPQKVAFFESVHVSTAAVGAAHSIAVDKNGTCYTWGKCHYGQLGQGEMDEDLHEPRILAFPHPGIKVSQVAAGDSHTMAITTAGRIFSWGCGYYGALGHGDEATLVNPRPIESLQGTTIISAAGGASHSLAITSDGRCFVWGRDQLGQLGLQPFFTDKSKQKVVRLNRRTPTEAPFSALGAVKIVSACAFCSLVLLDDGSVLTFGDGSSGQLGRKETDSDSLQQCLIDPANFLNESVSFVACGYKHCTAVSDKGTLFTWGSGKFGRLGTGSSVSQSRPARIASQETFSQVACGEAHTIALATDGRVWSWGSAHYGKLGLDADPSGSIEVPQQIKDLRAVRAVLSGTNHSMVIAEKRL